MKRGGLIASTFVMSGLSAWLAAWAHRAHYFHYSISLSLVSIIWGVWCLYETHKWAQEGGGPSNPPLD